MDFADKDTTHSMSGEFSIHTLNCYSNVILPVIQNYLYIDSQDMRFEIREMHRLLIKELGSKNIDYRELRSALVPVSKRHEGAYIFYTDDIEDADYGRIISEHWLPVLKNHGPEKTAIHHGDILGLSNHFVSELLDNLIVPNVKTGKHPLGLYYAVYFSNLSSSQLVRMHDNLTDTCDFYMGYVDCTVQNSLKNRLLLPQYGLRHMDSVITQTEDSDVSSLNDFPIDKYGFKNVGISNDSYDLFLNHKIDKKSSAWADSDGAMGLQVLGGSHLPLSEIQLRITDSRLEYLNNNHNASLKKALLSNSDTEATSKAVKEALRSSLLYDIRFKQGTNDGIVFAENDAVLFSLQIELENFEGQTRRYQVGVKYYPVNHAGEIVTFY